MGFVTNVDGRAVVRWTSCDWQSYPGDDALDWHPVRAGSQPEEGYYLLRVPQGGRLPVHGAGVREEYVVLEGALVDGDGTDLVAGDLVSYRPGARHQATSGNGCILLAFTARVDARGDDAVTPGEARRIANWKTAPFETYPGLPEVGEPLMWHDIRGNPVTAEGFYITSFKPGSTSAAHEHTGYEEFSILEGTLTDSDGTIYRAGDCVSLPPGSIHDSHSVDGCCVATMISGPFRTL